MMDKLKWCENVCGPLTKEQTVMVQHNIKKNTFVGAGKFIGGGYLMPMVYIGKTLNVIDKAGYYQLASAEGREKYVIPADFEYGDEWIDLEAAADRYRKRALLDPIK
jgi:hypothetical protein